MTIGALRQLIQKSKQLFSMKNLLFLFRNFKHLFVDIQEQGAFVPYRTFKFDTLKKYTTYQGFKVVFFYFFYLSQLPR